jgi:cellulose synthase/poly-beta-1,6-N-acetylglucosamine synthase-like glycosyltransferase
MLLPFAIAFFCILMLVVLMHAVYVLIYLKTMHGDLNSRCSLQGAGKVLTANDHADAAKIQPVAVVLCLRGVDPNLEHCFRGLSQQAGLTFELHVVVDSPEDPSLRVLRRWEKKFARLEIHYLEQRLETCSLKCSAILTAMEKISETIKVVAFLDADTVPDPNWLIDLIHPLSNSAVGATSGNRWFWTADPSLGTALREIWNVAAIVQMQLYNIPWGGSLAIRRDCIASTDLPSRWKYAFCEDTLLTEHLNRQGLKVVRVPNLICVNSESTSVADAVRWIVRQLLTIRLHNSRWPLVQMHAAATILTPLSLVIALIFLAAGSSLASLLVFAGFLIYQVTNAIWLKKIQNVNLKQINLRLPREQQIPIAKNPWNRWLAVALVQGVQPWACAIASFTNCVRWRGIEYKILDKGKIRMQDYRPLISPESTTQKQTHSVT